MRILLVSMLLLQGGDTAAGVKAWSEGRHRTAFEEFAAAAREAGDDAPPALLWNAALAALRSGALVEAGTLAEKAAACGGPEFRGLRDFLQGNVAWVRCAKAELQTMRPDAGAVLFDAAIAEAGAAQAAWQLAATSRPDWPEARRNVERAARKADELRKKKAEAEAQNTRKREERPEPPPPPEDPAGATEEAPPEVPPDLLRTELAADEVRRLFEKLALKEQERARVRRLRQLAPGQIVEKDW